MKSITSNIRDLILKFQLNKQHYFSSTLSHPTIEIINNNTTIKSIISDNWKSILFNKSIEEMNNFKQTYSIVIKKSKFNRIRFGFCQKNNALVNNFGDVTLKNCYLIRA